MSPYTHNLRHLAISLSLAPLLSLLGPGKVNDGNLEE